MGSRGSCFTRFGLFSCSLVSENFLSNSVMRCFYLLASSFHVQILFPLRLIMILRRKIWGAFPDTRLGLNIPLFSPYDYQSFLLYDLIFFAVPII